MLVPTWCRRCTAQGIPCMCIESIKQRTALIKVISHAAEYLQDFGRGDGLDAQNVVIDIRNIGNNLKP